MPRTSIKDKLAERGTKIKLEKYDMKSSWYYVDVVKDKSIKVIATDEPRLDELINDAIGLQQTAIALPVKDVFLIASPSPLLDKQQPTLYVKNIPYYGRVFIVCLLDNTSVSNIQPLPYSAIMPAVESLQFIKGNLPSIEVLPLNE
jgi:hypothetical protein